MNLNSRPSSAVLTSFLFFILFMVSFSASIAASTIEGYVYDSARNPLSDIDVELRNENGQMRGRTKTDSSGRYSFSELTDGRYYVKVFAFRHNLLDDEQMVRIDSLSILGGTGNHTTPLDFYLKSKVGGLSDTTTGVVFGQEVPKEWREKYGAAMKLTAKDEGRDEGFKQLIEVVEGFPTYYEALNSLGLQLLLKERYAEAASMFIRAAEVNPKSSKSFYYMGVALSNLGKDYYSAALIALNSAGELAPKAYQIPFEKGKIQKKLGNFLEAELNFVLAKKLAEVKNPEIHLQLAQLYGNELKKFDKAADELELYLKASDKKDPDIEKKIVDLRAKARKQT